MDFDQLVTFLEVTRQGSFSRAGEKVFRSQSAVSAQIRQLEQEYGDRLLDRSGKTVKLTPAGQVLFHYGERRPQPPPSRHASRRCQRGYLSLRSARGVCGILPALPPGADQHLPEFQ